VSENDCSHFRRKEDCSHHVDSYPTKVLDEKPESMVTSPSCGEVRFITRNLAKSTTWRSRARVRARLKGFYASQREWLEGHCSTSLANFMYLSFIDDYYVQPELLQDRLYSSGVEISSHFGSTCALILGPYLTSIDSDNPEA
jgi:hypothetical protein